MTAPAARGHGMLRAWPAALALLSATVPARAPGAEPAPAAAGGAAAAEGPSRALPIGAGWARERGIELPNPFGVGVFAVTMRRDIEVTDVRVKLRDGEPVSVSDVGAFAVRNDTTLAAVKLDAWVLPVLDVYVLGGHTWTDSVLDASFTVDPIGPRPPEAVQLVRQSEVGGAMVGGGATLVAGYGPWFILADGNYSWSDVEPFEGGIAAWFLSARTGWSGKTRWGGWRGWLGAAYLATQRTLTVRQESGLGTLTVEIDQRPVHPITMQGGASVAAGKRWEALVELGSNFDDAFLGIFSASFRF